ncbi:MAG: HAMP domain-containing histidine kinase [Flavobacteriales bacterium]|nr:HAMP domain-containing histidine kinase [Flavobacteriales bacterium]MDW8432915.1 HAMP domain-containing sensor histidine kinase [Flavobacteriales bacterium]
MRLRNRIFLFVSASVIGLTWLSSVIIYLLFAQYREEEFQQRLKEKIRFTIDLIKEYKELSSNLSAIMDKHTIHALYDEKILVFDGDKNLIYKSLDDLPIHSYSNLLHELSPSNPWIETKEGRYDVVAVYVESENAHFYAISKAYDVFGYSKLAYLRNILVIFSLGISLTALLMGYYLARLLARPISALAQELDALSFENPNISEISIRSNTREIQGLIEKFNQLIRRTNEAFTFQKHLAQHISHQLKTPLAAVLSEMERAAERTGNTSDQIWLRTQASRLKSLGYIIDTLLELARAESGKSSQGHFIRLDEILFDALQDHRRLNPEVIFDVQFEPQDFPAQRLELHQAHPGLLRQLFHILLGNAIAYASDQRVELVFQAAPSNALTLLFRNRGPILNEKERQHLFSPFFRGSTSAGKTGFGLGLALARRILDLHGAAIRYHNPEPDVNEFQVIFT